MNKSLNSPVFLCCGGTGGHLSPGIAVAQRLRESGVPVLLAISGKDVDSRLIQAYPEFSTIICPIGSISGGSLTGVMKKVLGQARNFAFAREQLRQAQPRCLVAFGGFLSVGFIIAAASLGIPILLHEANHVPGKVTRLLGKLAEQVLLPEGVFLPKLPANRQKTCGFPIRRELLRVDRKEAFQRLGITPSERVLVVMGGSQGAKALNDWAFSNHEKLRASGILTVCITGMRQQAASQFASLVTIPFCDDMPALLSIGNLAVMRAGAGSLAEAAALGLPAIVIPYPHAADNHQHANALFYAEKKGGVMLDQLHLEALLPMVLRHFETESSTGHNAIDHACMDAAQIVADEAIAVSISRKQLPARKEEVAI